ncbi:MAG TPA: DUF6569 family protein [Kofleriaceae bacterium]
MTLAVTVLPAAALADKPSKPGKPASTRLDEKTALLAPVTHDNLTIFPVVTTAAKISKVDYLVLDEGMKSKKVRILEKGDGGSVNELTIRNTSERPLFLMAGEVVIGGKQDRIIGKNTIVAPRTTETIPVFCVEHGRWNGRKAEFTSAGALAHTELRKKANFSDQGEVWGEVAAKNAKRKLDNDTDTYRGVAQSASVVKSIGGYQKAFAGKLGKVGGRERQIGFVVALGGKVVAIETFGSPKLFKKFEQKLLRSYYVEAIDAEHAADGAAIAAPKPADVTEFAGKARRAKRETVLDKKSGKTVQFEDELMKGTAVEAEDGAPVYQGAYE